MSERTLDAEEVPVIAPGIAPAIAPGIAQGVADASRSSSGLRKRSVTIAGHATSLSLEDVFWRHLKRIADARRLSLAALVAEVDRTRGGNLSSALRVLVVEDLEARAASREEAGVPAGDVSS